VGWGGVGCGEGEHARREGGGGAKLPRISSCTARVRSRGAAVSQLTRGGWRGRERGPEGCVGLLSERGRPARIACCGRRSRRFPAPPLPRRWSAPAWGEGGAENGSRPAPPHRRPLVPGACKALPRVRCVSAAAVGRRSRVRRDKGSVCWTRLRRGACATGFRQPSSQMHLRGKQNIVAGQHFRVCTPARIDCTC